MKFSNLRREGGVTVAVSEPGVRGAIGNGKALDEQQDKYRDGLN